MRTVKWTLALLFFSGFLNPGIGFAQPTPQTPGTADAVPLPDAAAYSMVERGPNHRLWQKFSVAGTDQSGAPICRTNQFCEIATGMNFWDGQRWTPSDPSFVETPDGFVAANVQHPVTLSSELNTMTRAVFWKQVIVSFDLQQP